MEKKKKVSKVKWDENGGDEMGKMDKKEKSTAL